MIRASLHGLLAVGLSVCLSTTGVADVGDEGDLPDLRFTEERFDFGCVGVDFKVFHDYKLINYGPDTIRIDTVTAHCDCTRVRFGDSVVAPDDTAAFRIIFNTTGFYGLVEKDVRVHSSDRKSPKAYTYYRANIGQWLYSIEPKPVSVFFLPGQKTKTSTLLNHVLDKISLLDVFLLDDIVQVKTVRDQAAKGESIELEVVPNPDLPAGTHLTNFTVTVDLHQNLDPLRITIPVKVVKY